MKDLNRDRIRIDLERDYQLLSEDLESLKKDLIRLGSAVSDNEEKRAKEYRMLEFHASIVNQMLNITKRLIVHAEYCDQYIVKNEACHTQKQSQIDALKDGIEPLIRAKRWYKDTKTIAAFIASAIGLIAAWQGYLAYLSKVGGGE